MNHPRTIPADFPAATVREAAFAYLKLGFGIIPAYSPRMFRCPPPLYMGSRLLGSTSKARIALRCTFSPIRSEARLKAFFRRHPHMNILLATGKKAGIVVIDVDYYYTGGVEKLRALNLPETLKAQSGRGEHWYYRYPESESHIPSLVKGVCETLSVLADHGQVIAPPSMHANGNLYRWLNPGTEMLPLPPQLLAEIKQHPAPGRLYVLRKIFRLYVIPKYVFIPAFRLYFWLKARKAP